MNLISREKVRRLICENNDKYGYSDRFHEFTDEVLNNLPSAFEGMTNGEVIKALFPNMGVHVLTEDDETIYEVDIDDDNYMSFTEKFWNAPYKGVSE